MRAILTGATGFIGQEIVNEFKQNDLELFQIGYTKKTSAEENFFQIDITDFNQFSVLQQLKKIDVVIHSAGLAHQFGDIEKEKFDAVNVKGTINVLNLAVNLKARKFILISSTAVYGEKKFSKKDLKNISKIKINEETECQPETFYAESKLKAEQAAREICEKNKIELVVLRLAPVIGEGNKTANTARLIKSIDKSRFLWIGRGENYKSLIYKKDVARACRIIALKDSAKTLAETDIFNLADKPVRMNQIVRTMASKLGKTIPEFRINPAIFHSIFYLNSKFLHIKKLTNLSRTVEKWLSSDVYDSEKIEKIYGFKPETSTLAAIEKQVDWYKLNS